MQRPEVSPRTLRRYEEIAGELAALGAEAGQMFGMPTLKVRRKVFAGLWGDAMAFKLPTDAREEPGPSAAPSPSTPPAPAAR